MIEVDEIREAVLKFLYDYSKKRGDWVALHYACMEVKKLIDGLDRKDVLREIYYLIDEGYIKKRTETTKGILAGGSYKTEQIRISSTGIQRFEKTKFTKQRRFSSISLEGDNNVVVFGDNLGSITQTKGSSIEELNKLIEATKQSSLSEEEKMNLIGDIETIKSQLIKPNPIKAVIQSAWLSISAAATFSGAHDFIVKIQHFLSGWIAK